ncbi:hypothetical protein CTI12_AA124730 [Artemisia annua]|uniref:Uncharacterized protein n=1 Tax=Artemisia annua TaxID=35608 RepID=A0A2U1PQ62_ARTAN|nr:hypothetical protein CTI12_AA124730 [Artemisia annua]
MHACVYILEFINLIISSSLLLLMLLFTSRYSVKVIRDGDSILEYNEVKVNLVVYSVKVIRDGDSILEYNEVKVNLVVFMQLVGCINRGSNSFLLLLQLMKLIPVILGHLWTSDHPEIRARIELLLKQRKMTKNDIKNVLQYYIQTRLSVVGAGKILATIAIMASVTSQVLIVATIAVVASNYAQSKDGSTDPSFHVIKEQHSKTINL